MITSRRGFTLIELMIVVALISVLSAIAVPNFLRARMTANETNAVASLRSIAEAQSIFKRTDWDKDGVFEYACYLSQLYSTYQNEQIELINRNIAAAHRYGFPRYRDPTPYSGYVFFDNWGYFREDGGLDRCYVYREINGMFRSDWHRFGARAWPSSYNMTGRNSFMINDSGVVYQNDVDIGSDMVTPDYGFSGFYYWWWKPSQMKAWGWLVMN